MKNIVAAVDGPAGSGKSSVCKEAAAVSGLKYIDSGAIYRSVTLFVIETAGAIDRETCYRALLKDIKIEQIFTPEKKIISFLNGRDVSSSIRDERITSNIGLVSDSADVRNFVNFLLRRWAEGESVLMDGRDIGSVVFPEADIKIYLDASIDVRAKRRINEYREMGKNLDEIAVKNQIIQRDSQDMSRSYGRLVRLKEAVYIDSSDLTFDAVVEKIKFLIASVQNPAG